MEHEDTMARDEAFARWYRQHHARIHALCTRILRDPSAAEDVAQEAMLRAWTRRDELREEDLGAWLSVVARNLCVSSLRKDRRLVPIETITDPADPGQDPQAVVERKEQRRVLRQALDALDPRPRRILYEREIGQAAYEDIGTDHGLTAAGVRTIVFRARKAMRDHLVAVGQGLGAWVVGIRVRLRQIHHRTVSRVGVWVEGPLAPTVQLGIGVALAANLAFGGGLSLGPATAVDALGLHRADATAPTGEVHGATALASPIRKRSSPSIQRNGRNGPSMSTAVNTGEDPSIDVSTKTPNRVTGEDTTPGVTIYFNDKGPVTPRLIDAYNRECEKRKDLCERIGRSIRIGEGT